MEKLGPDHFRYFDELNPKGLEVVCKKFVVIGETEHCWYIVDEFYHGLFGSKGLGPMLKKYRKRVLKYGGEHGRRFAYTDKSLALKSYQHRKRWQIRHAQLSLERAKAAIGYFGDHTIENIVPKDRIVIPCEYIESMNWE